MLGGLIDKHNVDVYLVNTGWSGGEYGVGKRMDLKYTRSMVRRAISGELALNTFEEDTAFGLSIPTSVAGVPKEILNPRNTWVSEEAYDEKALKLKKAFIENFKKFGTESEDIAKQGGFSL